MARRLVVPDDYFNPFDILNLSHHYDAHVVPEVSAHLRAALLRELEGGDFAPHDGGVYVQTAGPRFETKAEVRFFAQFGVRLLCPSVCRHALARARRSHALLYPSPHSC